MKRLATAAVGIPVLLLTIIKGPVWLCFGLVALSAALAAAEACRLLQTPRRRPLAPVAMCGAAVLGIPFAFPGLSLPFLLMGALSAILLCSVIARRDLGEVVETAMATSFATLLVGLPLAFLTGLRALDGERGRGLLALLLVVVWIGDTAAYYVGSLVGRHRLAPTISPKKTVEGAIAGLAAGIGGAFLAHFWWYPELGIGHAVAVGVILGAAGLLGDLAESILKRAAGAKDSSAILPGHGGFLDRVDSLLFAGPALYYYYVALLR